MNHPLTEIYNRVENLSILCKVMAEFLEEAEDKQLNTNEFSACFYHLCESLDQILDQMDLWAEES